ncbi:MAG: hypothetical protein JSS10_08640 [Verrucomicrobia bacterium]|nr:hypothetical protein [Verrucomicrobiota bacterium]
MAAISPRDPIISPRDSTVPKSPPSPAPTIVSPRREIPTLKAVNPDDLKMRELTIETKRPSARSILKPSPNFAPEVKENFAKVHSNELISLPEVRYRADFKKAIQGGLPLKPVILSPSHFVSKSMIEHLMRNKKDSALGVKYKEGDKVTWMEGALHTFLTPICPIVMSGDYYYKNGHQILFTEGKGRQVILSASIQPDFEKSFENEVIMRVVKVQEEAIEGQDLDSLQPLWNLASDSPVNFKRQLKEYEARLQKHMIYHLTSKHRLPALKEVRTILDPSQALEYIDQLIKNSHLDEQVALVNQFVRLEDHVISLEALFSIYFQLVRNEFSVFEAVLLQGYVYTIDPPVIFARQIGVKNVNILNRLQILAFKSLRRHSPFPSLKIIGFNDYADKEAIVLLKMIFPDKTILPKQELFRDKHYSVREGYALVLHNNSDAFGQNIETEEINSSMDGAIGSCSDAACQLQRDRVDLLNYIFQ